MESLHTQKGPGFKSRVGPFYVEFACPSHTCVSHPVSSHSPKNALVRVISESKLAVGVNIMVNGCVMLQQTGKKPRIYPSSPL